MKVLNFIQLKNYNGTSSFFINTTKEFLYNNSEVIAIINKKSITLKEKLLEEKNDNLRIVVVSSNKFKAFFQYIRIILKNRKDSIAFMHDTQRFPLLLTKIFGIKNYTSIFGEGERKIHKFIKIMDNILVAKKYQLYILKEKYPKKNIYYFPYTITINDNDFSMPNNKETFTFGCLGIFYKIKGFNELIEACEILKNKGYKFKLLIGGFGSRINELKNLVKNKDLENYCIFLGKIIDKKEFYKKLNIFCFTSYKEDIGFVIPEAISYGIPIIGNRIGFTSDALDENDYLIAEAENLKDIENKWPKNKYTKVWWEAGTNYRFETEPLDPKLLAEKMEFAMNNYNVMKEKSVNAYKKVKNEYNLRNNIKEIFYNKL